MVIRYCPLSPNDYPLLSDISLRLTVVVRYHPMGIRYCPPSTYDYPSAITLWLSVIVRSPTLWLSVIVRYHPMIIRYCPMAITL